MDSAALTADFARLEAFPAALRQQVQVLGDGVLRFKPENEWSSIENVGHLIDIEHVWRGRFQGMLGAEHPVFPRVDVDELVRQHDYQHKDMDTLLRTFAELRAETLAFLRTLKPAQLERTGVHPVRGDMTVAGGVGIMASHDQLHADQIAKTVAQAER